MYKLNAAAHAIISLIIIYMKKLLDSDSLTAVPFFCTHMAKKGVNSVHNK